MTPNKLSCYNYGSMKQVLFNNQMNRKVDWSIYLQTIEYSLDSTQINPFPNKPGCLRVCSTISSFPKVFTTHSAIFLPF